MELITQNQENNQFELIQTGIKKEKEKKESSIKKILTNSYPVVIYTRNTKLAAQPSDRKRERKESEIDEKVKKERERNDSAVENGEGEEGSPA